MIGLLFRFREAERMVAYTVHEPPQPAQDRLDRAESLVFVKDGFNWLAALLTPFWLIANQMWLVLIAYLFGIIAISSGLSLIGVPPVWIALIEIAVNILIGFEADSLKRWTLDRKGWQMVGTVSGRNSSECERRFFESWLPRQPVLRVEGTGGHGMRFPRRGDWFGNTARADA